MLVPYPEIRERLLSMKKDIHLSEITEAGRGTTEWVVRAGADESREWLVGAPDCAALRPYGIVHVGIAEAAHPYRVVRTDLSGTFVMMCLSGQGQVGGNDRAIRRVPESVHFFAKVSAVHRVSAIGVSE